MTQQDSFQETTLHERLQQVLQPDDFAHYRKVYEYHFWEWKMHRICETNSLRGLRSFLYHAGILKLERDRRPIRSRPFHSYAAELGIPIDISETHDPFSATKHPSYPNRREFPNPGDCRELYENCKPGWIMHGYGKTLNFSLEQTLRNCLIEALRGDENRKIECYMSPSFYGALKKIEIWSVADFALSVGPGKESLEKDSSVSPCSMLVESIAAKSSDTPLQEFLFARAAAQTFLDKARTQGAFDRSGEILLFGTMLGYLLDELILRTAIPNGMAHWYSFAHGALSALKDNFAALEQRLRDMHYEPSDLKRTLASLIETASRFPDGNESGPKQTMDEGWRHSAVQVADTLRNFGYECRSKRLMDDKEADLVFTAANSVWRWVFFLEQRNSFTALEPSLSPEYRTGVVELVWQWLRRPWGIVTTDDIERAFRGLAPGDEKDATPRAFTVLMPILKADIEDHLIAAFKVASREKARDLLLRFIRHRVDLYLARHLVRRLRQPPAEDDAAHSALSLIDLFLTWVFEMDTSSLEIIDKDLDSLPKMLRSGKWMRDYVARVGDPGRLWPPPVAATVAEYLKSPESFVSRVFRFDEPEFRIQQWVGVYLPESFTFTSPVSSTGEQTAEASGADVLNSDSRRNS